MINQLRNIFVGTWQSNAYRLFALALALNYFSFRTELFHEEYEEFHPQQTSAPSISVSSVNWESFDKDNAPKAFIVSTAAQIELICFAHYPLEISTLIYLPYQPVRDKSPPPNLFS